MGKTSVQKLPSQQPRRKVPITDSWQSAQAAGLRYVVDTSPGIQRRRYGKGFRYLDVDGTAIRDKEVIRRINALRIPPAWIEVWICARPDGHLQATGRDARGRKQYRYHPYWRTVRDTTKYDRLIALGEVLPQLRSHVEQDLARPGLPREKVLATVVRLLETTLIRIGNVEYARDNRSFGLTTLRDRHVEAIGSTVQFQFRGKSGQYHTIRLTDRRVATIVRRCQDLPGYELFQYIDAAGQRQTIDSADVNTYLREVTGQDFTAKDIRTWAGTVLTACALGQMDAFRSEAEAKRNIVQAMDIVAKRLGNTRAVCRKCYVHPLLLEAYGDRSLCALPPLDEVHNNSALPPSLQPAEATVLTFLRQKVVSG